MSTIDLCMDCVLAAGINPARGDGSVEGCDACGEQQKRASRYELSAVVAALVRRIRTR